MIFIHHILCKNVKTKNSMVVSKIIENVIYSIPPIHAHPLLRTLKAWQNDDLIQVLTYESLRNTIMPFGKPSHTKQNHHVHTFLSTASLLLVQHAV